MTAIAEFINDLRRNIYVLGLAFGNISKECFVNQIYRGNFHILENLRS